MNKVIATRRYEVTLPDGRKEIRYDYIGLPDREAYEFRTLLHEAGHALGVGYGNDGRNQNVHHPQTRDSVMSYDPYERMVSYCSPTPLDALAIYALYQTVD